jgi:hypothetical protein
MAKPRSGWWCNPFLLGLLIGWVVGMLWWTGLMIAFGPSMLVTLENGMVTETRISVLSRLRYAPLVAIPWALVGLFVGWLTSGTRGFWVPAFSGIGGVVGGVVAVANHPFDGWIWIFMLGLCLVGAFVGAVVGAVCPWALPRDVKF